MIDTHSHVYAEQFDSDFDLMIQRAKNSGIENIIVPATKPSEYHKIFNIINFYENYIYGCLGIHPHHAHEINDQDLLKLENLSLSKNILAIGEIGLDYHYDFCPREIQKDVFRKQLRIAKKLKLPVVIHNRESDEDVLQILNEEKDDNLRIQLHCFSSNLDVLKEALKLGSFISFTGNITFKNSNLNEIVNFVPDDKIMIETDAPYMSPVPYRGKRNEPGYLGLIAQKLSEIKNRSLQEIISMTTKNARTFFNLTTILFCFLMFNNLFSQSDTNKTSLIKTKGIVGFGPHFGTSTIIVGSETDANSISSYGGWVSFVPPTTWNFKWLQLDVAYTYFKNSKLADSSYSALLKIDSSVPKIIPPNTHQTIDIAFRFIGNPSNRINFYATIGLTYFKNRYGVDEYFYTQRKDSTFDGFEDTGFGLCGGVGCSYNLDLDFGTFSPTAEYRASSIMTDRQLKRRNGEFFLSQIRFGIYFYPKF